MNNIDYNQSGGFPLSTQILDAGQQAYKNFNAFGNFAGALSIIDGCEPASGGTVTNGFVSIYGELLPFLGNTISANVIIVEVPDARGFEDGSVKAVIYSRYATFGDGVVTYPWANFRRPMTLFQLEDRLLQLEKSVPVGLVAVWGNFIDAIPEGWLPWDISQGCVIVNRKPGDPNFGAASGTKIGVAQVTLTEAQLPSINKSQQITQPFEGTIPNGQFNGGSEYTFFRKTINWIFGGGQSHTNIQPSLIADHMIFVGF